MTPAPAVPQIVIPSALEKFEGASPQLLEARLLLRRIDRKFVLHQSLLDPLLRLLSEEYQVVQSSGQPAATYDTLYFDTPELRFYHDHMRGVRRRYKVRIRHYIERQLTFLEIKGKEATIATTKSRLARAFGNHQMDEEARSFVAGQCPLDPRGLFPQLWILYRRITLVGKNINERITLDWGIEVRNNQMQKSLAGLAIAEIKQARQSNASCSIQAFRELRLREHSLSKYCLATSLLFPVRTNLFRPAFRAVERLLT